MGQCVYSEDFLHPIVCQLTYCKAFCLINGITLSALKRIPLLGMSYWLSIQKWTAASAMPCSEQTGLYGTIQHPSPSSTAKLPVVMFAYVSKTLVWMVVVGLLWILQSLNNGTHRGYLAALPSMPCSLACTKKEFKGMGVNQEQTCKLLVSLPKQESLKPDKAQSQMYQTLWWREHRGILLIIKAYKWVHLYLQLFLADTFGEIEALG